MKWSLAPLAAAAVIATPALADKAARQAQESKDIAAGEAQLAKLTKGLVPGEPRACAPTERWTGSTNIEGVGILYEYGATKYLNRFQMGCAQFGFDSVPVIVSHGATCRGDLVRLVDRGAGFTTGSCTLGDFTPYSKPRGDRDQSR